MSPLSTVNPGTTLISAFSMHISHNIVNNILFADAKNSRGPLAKENNICYMYMYISRIGEF